MKWRNEFWLGLGVLLVILVVIQYRSYHRHPLLFLYRHWGLSPWLYRFQDKRRRQLYDQIRKEFPEGFLPVEASIKVTARGVNLDRYIVLLQDRLELLSVGPQLIRNLGAPQVVRDATDRYLSWARKLGKPPSMILGFDGRLGEVKLYLERGGRDQDGHVVIKSYRWGINRDRLADWEEEGDWGEDQSEKVKKYSYRNDFGMKDVPERMSQLRKVVGEMSEELDLSRTHYKVNHQGEIEGYNFRLREGIQLGLWLREHRDWLRRYFPDSVVRQVERWGQRQDARSPLIWIFLGVDGEQSLEMTLYVRGEARN